MRAFLTFFGLFAFLGVVWLAFALSDSPGKTYEGRVAGVLRFVDHTIVALSLEILCADSDANTVTGISATTDGNLYFFFDGFEDYAVESKIGNGIDMYTKQGGPWAQYLIQRGPNSEIEVTDDTSVTTPLSGTNMMRFEVVEEDLEAAGGNGVKSKILKHPGGEEYPTPQHHDFVDGEILSYIVNFYYPSATNNWWYGEEGFGSPRILNIVSKENGLGPRVGNTGAGGTISLTRDQIPGLGNIGTGVRVDLDRWIKLEVRMKVGVLPDGDEVNFPGQGRGFYDFNESDDAWIQIILDDSIILQQSATTRSGSVGDGTVMDTISVGESISGSPSEMFVDDFTLQTVTEPFVE